MFYLKDHQAFSLIELVVSITVLLIVSTIAAVQLNSYKKEDALTLSTEKLISAIEFARSSALAGIRYTQTQAVDSYGIVIGTETDNTYFIFANPKDDQELYYETGLDYKIEQKSFFLEKGIIFSTAGHRFNIVYRLPYAQVDFYEDDIKKDEDLSFPLQTEDGALVTHITVNRAGSIKID